MYRGIVVLVAVLQFLCLVQVRNCSQLTVQGSVKQFYKPGDVFTFTCSGQIDSDDTFHFTKLSTTIPTIDGKLQSGDDVNGTILSTFGDLDPLLVNMTDRYEVSGTKDENSFNYVFTITDVQPEDIGNYSCRTKDVVHPMVLALTVLAPIQNMSILPHEKNSDRLQLKNHPENDNDDGIITFNTTDDIDVVCMVTVSTLPPIFWEMTLHDPVNSTTENVTNRFSSEYTEAEVIFRNGGLRYFTIHDFFMASTTNNGIANQFGFQDNGKTLTFKAQTQGYDVQEISTVLNIQFPPTETGCASGFFQAPIGTTNFTLICFTRSNPVATVTWKANEADLRPGITVHNENKEQYLVSILVIDKIQSSDFTDYKFHAENMLGMEEARSDNVIEGSTVVQASMNSEGLPWYEEPDISAGAKSSLITTIQLAFFLAMGMMLL